ncbi:hypothetical protein KIN20_010447 [Parelaphostrongylus tenuis]|uniref:Uncharacterized protein n=1 Tax=Parelaphostrongylus tenuis TaxID=148309 RepID=A0AAD5M7W5_PARTN|nr:hypothetical protein KIN20_010447 [Parelaphostrongylus tenuis]
MVNDRIEWTKEQIDSCRRDEQMIVEFVTESFVEELKAIWERSNYVALRDSVKRLEDEIEELRRRSPKSVPPPRPARPLQHLTWSCVRCLEENPITVYRCQCSFPRPVIDPREASRCNCTHCSELTANRMFLSPTPGDGDWLLVNKLSPNNGSATSQ